MKRSDITPEALIPHRGRMKLVDGIIEVDDKRAVTSATVTGQWPLFKDKTVHSLVCIELVAQTAGVSNCWNGINKHGKDFVNRGWLVGIKSAVFHLDAIPLDARVITRTENQFEYEGYREILGTVETGSKLIAEVRLQLMQSE
ncbi:MAG: hypothetical protein P1P89_18380 [Desulfobacterales bacterium]|nr:hypothetical protein [Desulfobacterales bacterium]